MAKPTIASLTEEKAEAVKEALSLQTKLATAQRALRAHDETAKQWSAQIQSSLARANAWQLVADEYAEPIIVALNKAQQARDNVPLWLWKLVPALVRAPIDFAFTCLQAYESNVGALKQRFHLDATLNAGAVIPPGNISGLTSVPASE